MHNKLTAQLLNPTTVLVTGSEALWDWRETQTLPVPGHEFTPQYRSGRWDGLYRPGKWCRDKGNDIWEMQCSRGLLGRLKIAFAIEFAREKGPHNPINTFGKPLLDQLRDYQRDALNFALEHKWGRIALATNAGKGAVIALLAEFATRHDIPVRILCDELAVFDALEGELLKWTSLNPGRVQQGVKDPPTDLVVLCMVPTLAKRIGSKDPEQAYEWRSWMSKCGMLLLDEADKATAKSWGRIITHAKNTHWRLGFSGSFPNPKENPLADLKLDELMGPILIKARNIDLIQQKVSAIPLVTLHGFDATDSITRKPQEWWLIPGASRRQMVFEQAVIDNLNRHHFIQSLIRSGTSTAIVVNRIAHGHALAETIPNSVFLDGSADQKERLTVLAAFQKGAIKVLIVTKILDRGTNRLGHVSDLLFVSAEGSTRQTLQRIGRGLRRTGGKEYLRLIDIIDHIDTDTGFGFVTKAANYLHTAARKRIRLYQEEGFQVELVK